MDQIRTFLLDSLTPHTRHLFGGAGTWQRQAYRLTEIPQPIHQSVQPGFGMRVQRH